MGLIDTTNFQFLISNFQKISNVLISKTTVRKINICRGGPLCPHEILSVHSRDHTEVLPYDLVGIKFLA